MTVVGGEADRQDIVDCYRHLLGREPESEAVIEQRLGKRLGFWDTIIDIIGSQEHKHRSGITAAHATLRSFSPRYLALGLSESIRLSCAAYNYGALQKALRPSSFVQLTRRGLSVFDGIDMVSDLAVDLVLFGGPIDEGEISLVLKVAGRPIAIIGFTIVAAADFGCAGDSALLISRVQGFTGVAAETRETTRRMDDISPPYLLMCVLEGMAKAQDIGTIIGVNAHAQPGFQMDLEAHFVRAYDTFFLSLGAAQRPDGLYAIGLPRPERSFWSVPIGHRARARRKRARKQAIADAACDRWKTYLRNRLS